MMLLPLYSFFEILGFDPWHAFGIAGTGDLKADRGCDSLVRRYEWQNSDAAGHKAIAEAIETAETKLRDYLGYSVAPRYVTETLPWPAAWPSDGRWPSVTLGEGYIRAMGVEQLTAIAAGAAVTYSDVDGDGIDDTFTLSAATTVTDASEIAVYVAAGDRFDAFGATSAIGERWRVQPIRATISGGIVTVTGPKQLCVKPLKYEGRTNIGANGLEPDDATAFVTTLDLYRRTTNTSGTTDATAHALIVWETRPAHGWWCCCGCQESSAYDGSPYDPAAIAQAAARVGIRDSVRGIVTPAEAAYDSTAGTWSALSWSVCDMPDRVTVRYLAGYPLGADNQMQEPYRTIVARLAAAELARPVCGCESANRELARWQFDLARSAGANDEAYVMSPEDLNNPFGTRRGHVFAWRAVQRLATLTGFLA